MPMPVPAAEAASAALATGDFATARVLLEAAVGSATVEDAPGLHEQLARACVLLEDYEAAIRHGQAAFRLFLAAGQPRRAAFAAMVLANLHNYLGSHGAMRGWLNRASRVLEGEGPCLERGYLAVAITGCDVRDVAELERQTEFALAIARRFGDADLEVRALADSGLALVALGRVQEGLDRLDEAMAAVVSGDVENFSLAGQACCAMLHVCDRLNDVERGADWTRAVAGHAAGRFAVPTPRILLSHCRIAYGALLLETGRWSEAEGELRRALETSRAVNKRLEATGRLAELLVRQDRLADAEELLDGSQDSALVAGALARLHLARGDLELAEGTVRRALRQVRGDLPWRLRLLTLLTEVLLRRRDLAGAERAAGEALEIATLTERPGLLALANLAAARAAAARGADPVPQLEEALRALGGLDRPVLAADIRLELAQAERDSNSASAIGEAQAALGAFERLGMGREADRAGALLRSLGVRASRSRPAQQASATLTRREREILALLGEGLTNAEIARRLFISSRTAEHHVASVLGKLGLRRRAEAAAMAGSGKPGAG